MSKGLAINRTLVRGLPQISLQISYQTNNALTKSSIHWLTVSLIAKFINKQCVDLDDHIATHCSDTERITTHYA